MGHLMLILFSEKCHKLCKDVRKVLDVIISLLKDRTSANDSLKRVKGLR